MHTNVFVFIEITFIPNRRLTVLIIWCSISFFHSSPLLPPPDLSFQLKNIVLGMEKNFVFFQATEWRVNNLLNRQNVFVYRSIGEGAFGVVYRGYYKKTGETTEMKVAIKVCIHNRTCENISSTNTDNLLKCIQNTYPST